MAVPPPACPHRLLPLSLGLFQGALLLFFTFFITYDEPSAQAEDANLVANQLSGIFPLFQDIQVMLVVGLGLLLTFLPRYGLSVLTHNFVLLNFSTQWALVLQGLLHHFQHGRVHLDLRNLLTAEFAAVTVLISVGAVLGRTSLCQLLDRGSTVTPVHPPSSVAVNPLLCPSRSRDPSIPGSNWRNNPLRVSLPGWQITPG
uniref:Ammonium transporter AmtB-like domain-containing protein n=1 Tax=Buteo japonicus TaxID=224669 RepID=A0A8C0AQW0_9AVES